MARSMMQRLLAHIDWPPGRRPGSAPEPSSSPPPPPAPLLPSHPLHADADVTDVEDARRTALRKAFTPTHPLRSARRLAGRRTQLARVLRAMLDESAHVVMYAERGRGKTSLINLVSEALRALAFMVGSYSCAAEDDFDAILRGLMRSLPRSLLAVPVQQGEDRLLGCEAALPDGRLQTHDVLGLTGRFTGRRMVLVVDEFDRVTDVATRTRLADTIKLLSDRAAPILFIIVGVSDNLEELLGRHPSIQRNVVSVPLPLLTDTEIEALLERGAQEAGLVFPPAARYAIAGLARGVPYIAQLLALHAGYSMLRRGSQEIARADLDEALEIAVAEADPRVSRLYETLTEGGRDAAMRAFLRSLANGTQDAFGRFVVEPAGPGFLSVAGRAAPAELWQRLVDAGAVRRCGDGGPHLFAMAEATFGNYVLMRAARDGPERRAETLSPVQATVVAR